MKYALLMICTPGSRPGYFRERSVHGPVNWYRWTPRAKRCWLNKRYPGWTGVCNGDPIRPRFFYQ